jgi:hypothetical protein
MNAKTLKIHISDFHPNNKKFDISEVRIGTLPVSILEKITPMHGENRTWHIRNGKNFFGNYEEKEWDSFVLDIKENGMKYPITIFVEYDGSIVLAEGNHRLQVAKQLHWESAPVEIRYFENSQLHHSFFDKYTERGNE